MPSEVAGSAAEHGGRLTLATVRILRLAFGTAFSLLVSQLGAWPMSFIAPVLTLALLSAPIPAMGLKGGVKLFVVLMVSVIAGLILLPFILNQRMVGLLLLTIALFHSFYFTARGGPAMIGSFVTIGLAIVTAVGTVSVDAVVGVVEGLGMGAFAGISCMWVAHALLPDRLADATASVPAPPVATAPAESSVVDHAAALWLARRSAFRSLLIVMPIIIWFLLSSGSASYVAVLIKVASMGQQAELDQTRQAAKSLLLSTVIGGIGAVIAWQMLSIMPSLALYTLLIALAALLMGPRIFSGQALGPNGATWSYGLLTMLVVLAPAVTDSQTGSAADAAFWSRLLMFGFATVYAIVAVFLYDTLLPKKKFSGLSESPGKS